MRGVKRGTLKGERAAPRKGAKRDLRSPIASCPAHSYTSKSFVLMAGTFRSPQERQQRWRWNLVYPAGQRLRRPRRRVRVWQAQVHGNGSCVGCDTSGPGHIVEPPRGTRQVVPGQDRCWRRPVRYSTMKYRMEWHGSVRFGSVRYRAVRHRMARHGTYGRRSPSGDLQQHQAGGTAKSAHAAADADAQGKARYAQRSRLHAHSIAR